MSNTMRQLLDVFRAEVSKILNNSLIKDLFDLTQTTIRHKDYPEEWFATFRTAVRPETIQGFHSDNALVFIIDEASGFPTKVLEAVEGALTQRNNMLMLFGNPTQIGNAFHDSFNSKKQFYYTFTLNSTKSPLVKPQFYEKIEAKYGKDSNVYRVRVLGEFPRSSPDTLIPIDICENAAIRELEIPSYVKTITLGVDCARFGTDESSIYSRIDKVIKEELILAKNDIMELVGHVNHTVNKYIKEGFNKFYIAIDDSGLGGGATDRLRELNSEGYYGDVEVIIMPINNGSSPKDKKQYANKSIEMWHFAKEFLVEAQIPNDNDLIGQLSSRKYKLNSKDQLLIESKDEMKKRGLSSPDRADGVILTLAPLIYQMDILTTLDKSIPEQDVKTLKSNVEEFNVGSIKDRMSFFKSINKNKR